MAADDPSSTSPLRAHTATAVELKERLAAERAGDCFLVLRDAAGGQQLVALARDRERIVVGRDAGADVALPWDHEVSRVHAELARVGGRWTVADDGLSRNGTFVNGERISGRRRLDDGDVLRVGRTHIGFREPAEEIFATTLAPSGAAPEVQLSDAQRRVLVALCRPVKDGGRYATPAPNGRIGEELFLSVDAVKTHMRTLFHKFGVEDLPQNQKRARLVELALQSGVVSEREL